MTDVSNESQQGGEVQDSGSDRGTLGELPKIDFSSLVLSLGTTALFQMGAVQDLNTGQNQEMDILAVQQTIDTLEMLREKTVGNLTDEERKLIDSLLYEVRMRFVESKR